MNSETQNYKPDLYIIARIIKTLKEKKRLNKTTLATTTGLSYDKMIKYIDWMAQKGFIQIDQNGYLTLTQEGATAYDNLVQWIMKYVGQLKFPRLRPQT